MTLQLDLARGVLVVRGCVFMVGMKEEKINKNKLPQVLFYVLKSCEKSTKCPYRFVFKSQFVV